MKSKQTKRGEAKPTGAQTCAIVQRFLRFARCRARPALVGHKIANAWWLLVMMV